jgi:hypothetical protein
MGYFENAFRWSFFHHNLKMHGPNCKITFLSSGGAAQTALGILCACYVNLLHQDWGEDLFSAFC